MGIWEWYICRPSTEISCVSSLLSETSLFFARGDDIHKIMGYSYIDGMMKGEVDHPLKGDNLQCFRIH
jgi:hypothetical protein